jgi:hypothetical protein
VETHATLTEMLLARILRAFGFRRTAMRMLCRFEIRNDPQLTER